MAAVTGIGQIRCRRIANDAIATAVRRARKKWVVDISHMETLRPVAPAPDVEEAPPRIANYPRPTFGRRPAAFR
jgi:hypothetical protein